MLFINGNRVIMSNNDSNDNTTHEVMNKKLFVPTNL